MKRSLAVFLVGGPFALVLGAMAPGCGWGVCTPGDASQCGWTCPNNCSAGAQTQSCPILTNVTGTVTVWDCNIPPQYCNGAPGQNDGALPSCGCVICQTSEQAALVDAQQILAMQSVSVDPSGPPLQCRGPIATLSKAYDTGPLFTVGECTKVTEAMCKPCDDGAGGTLQSVGQHCAGDDVNPAPPGGYSCCHGLTCQGSDPNVPLPSGEMGTCQGTLQPCPQAQPNWQPLTTAMLRQIATAPTNNVDGCTYQTGITQSRTIGLAFEKWVLTTLGVVPSPPGPDKNSMLFLSPERHAQNTMNGNGGLPASVIPEFVGDQTMFPKSVLYEVKAVTGALTLGTSQWQILGLLDVANTVQPVPAGPHPPPAVFFITTGNTTVSTGVATKATAAPVWSVQVWQQKVLYDANGGSNPNLTLDTPTCLTPTLCAPPAPVPFIPNPGPPVSPLTSPTTPPSALIVQGDPDPAEVD